MSAVVHDLDEGDWKILLERIAQKNCTPIVGSGAVTGGPPECVAADKWKANLAQELAKEFEYPFEDATRIERVAQFISIKNNDASFPKERIARQLAKASPPDFTLENETHRVLAELKLPIYITSNFDDYLARALRLAEKEVRVSICRWNKYFPPDAPAQDPNDPDPVHNSLISYAIAKEGEEPGTLAYDPETDSKYKPTPANPLVYYFYGHMKWPQSLVVTEDDYFEFLLNLTNRPARIMPSIHPALANASVLFLGYKLSDLDFLVLCRMLAETFKGRTSKHIAVQLGPPADAMKEASVAYLEKYFEMRHHIKVYWGTCQQFIAALKRRLG
jgi:hypothetical protein